MARLPYPDLDAAGADVRELVLKLRSAHLFRMVAHAPTALRPFVHLGNALLFKGRLDPRLRELAILRTGHLCTAPYEVFQHRSIGRDVGLDAARIDATAAGACAPVYSPAEAAVLRYAEELVTDVRATDSTFAALERFLDAGQIVELTLVVGYYGMVARVLEALQVDAETEQKLHGVPAAEGPT
jgi:alkylhydroperoxidase family enzyme